MAKKSLTIVQLYPQEMNIYGDWGNVLTLKKRLEWQGYETEILHHEPGQSFPKNADIIVGGGGQDSGQTKVQEDLLKIGDELHKLAEGNTPMLMICGLYQLFGRFFRTNENTTIEGISLFKAETIAGDKRMIGNVNLETDFGQVVGYENHSGKTYLDKGQKAFGAVMKGGGNNGEDKTEGARYKNVVGSYLHGSLLPKNPELADFLIEQAAIKKFGEFNTPKHIDDSIANQARLIAAKRPR